MLVSLLMWIYASGDMAVGKQAYPEQVINQLQVLEAPPMGPDGNALSSGAKNMVKIPTDRDGINYVVDYSILHAVDTPGGPVAPREIYLLGSDFKTSEGADLSSRAIDGWCGGQATPGITALASAFNNTLSGLIDHSNFNNKAHVMLALAFYKSAQSFYDKFPDLPHAQYYNPKNFYRHAFLEKIKQATKLDLVTRDYALSILSGVHSNDPTTKNGD